MKTMQDFEISRRRVLKGTSLLLASTALPAIAFAQDEPKKGGRIPPSTRLEGYKNRSGREVTSLNFLRHGNALFARLIGCFVRRPPTHLDPK